MNVAAIVGRLTRDPEIRYSTNGNNTCVARFNVAVDRKFKREGQASADFINVIAFGKTAEFIEKYFTKGMKIGVHGSIQTGSYTNQSGQKVYTTEILAEDVEFVEKKNADATGDLPSGGNDGFQDIPKGIEEDLPFAQPGAKYNDAPSQQISMDDLPFSR